MQLTEGSHALFAPPTTADEGAFVESNLSNGLLVETALFKSENAARKYFHSLSQRGFSIGFGVTTPFVSASVGLSRDTSQDNTTSTNKDTSSLTLDRYMIATEAGFRLESSLLKLSQKAKSMLTAMETEQHAVTFLTTFGSHFYTGDYGLGGIFRLSASITSDKATSEQALKTTAISKLNATLSAPQLPDTLMSGTYTRNNELGSTSNDSSANLHADISLDILGTDYCTSPETFQKAVKTSNKKWAIVRRGDLNPASFEPIWKIVLPEYAQQSTLISKAWTSCFASEWQRLWNSLSEPEKRFLDPLL